MNVPHVSSPAATQVPLHERRYISGTTIWVASKSLKAVWTVAVLVSTFTLFVNLVILMVNPKDFRLDATIAWLLVGPLAAFGDLFHPSITKTVKEYPRLSCICAIGNIVLINFVLRFTHLSFHDSWVDALAVFAGTYVTLVIIKIYDYSHGGRQRIRDKKIKMTDDLAKAAIERDKGKEPPEVLVHPI